MTQGLHPYELLVCLPFVQLRQREVIHLGPIIIWPSHLFEEHVPHGLHDSFQELIEHMIDKGNLGEEHSLKGASPPQHSIACLSIHPSIEEKQQLPCLIDALSCLYFTAYYQDLYYNLPIPSFRVFGKLVPANWGTLCKMEQKTPHAPQLDHCPKRASLSYVDQEMAAALGKVLENIYLPHSTAENHSVSRRILRSVRNFVHAFTTPFENVTGQFIHFSQVLFEPEDLLFLSSSFEALLDLNPAHPSSDFKFKTRGIVKIKYSTAMDIFWKWVDGFFEMKEAMVRRGERSQTLFTCNPSFELSSLYIGNKLLIFILNHLLIEEGFLTSRDEEEEGASLNPIDRAEVILFFWPEMALLECIETNLANWEDPSRFVSDQEVVRALVRMYQIFHRRYLTPSPSSSFAPIQFHPAASKEINPLIKKILSHKNQVIQTLEGEQSIAATLGSSFWNSLESRVKSSS